MEIPSICYDVCNTSGKDMVTHMKSIKPGRGPSKMGAAGGIFAALFGVFWCIFTAAIGAWFMIPFGILFVGYSIYIAIYHHRNATSEDRYSLVDIVDSEEEPDPLNLRYGRRKEYTAYGEQDSVRGTSVDYCPYCGRPAEGDYDFCPGCGRKLPD